MGVFAAIALTLSLIFTLPPVQKLLAYKVSDYLIEHFDVDVDIDGIDLSYLGSVNLKNVLIRDHHGDTIIYVGQLRTSVVNINRIFRGKLELKNVSIIDGDVNFITYKNEEISAFNQFVDKFKKDQPDPTSSFILQGRNLNLRNLNFTLINYNKRDKPTVYYNDITGLVRVLNVYPNRVKVNLHQVSMKDNFDLDYQSLTTSFIYTKDYMSFGQLELITPYSKIYGDVRFDYPRGGLSSFEDEVLIRATFKDSDVSTKDISLFYKEISSSKNIRLTGDFKGKLNDFSVSNLDLNAETGVSIQGDLRFFNVVDREKDFGIRGNLTSSQFNYVNLTETFPTLIGPKVPKQVDLLGDISMVGFLDLKGDQMDADLQINSDLGGLNYKVLLANLSQGADISYKGDIALDSFDLGPFLQYKDLGSISMSGEVDGKGLSIETLNSDFAGKINYVELWGYKFVNIEADGRFLNGRFEGKMVVDDPNLQMTFTGLSDMSSSLNNFDFRADVTYSDLVALGVNKKDTISKFIGFMDVDIVGNEYENVIGSTRFKNLSYQNDQGEYYFADFDIQSSNKGSVKNFTINSTDIVNGYLRGDFKFREIPDLFTNLIGEQFSKFESKPITENQYLDFRFEIYNKIVEVFFPKIKLSTNTEFDGSVDSRDNTLVFNYQAPELLLDEHYFKDIYLSINSELKDSLAQLTLDRYRNTFYTLNEVKMSNSIENDTLHLITNFKGGKNETEWFDLDLYLTFDDENNLNFGFQESVMYLKNNRWVINPGSDINSNYVIYNPKTKNFDFNHIKLGYLDQRIEFYGEVRDSTYKDIVFEFDNVSLADISPDVDSLRVSGLMNGRLNFLEEDNYYSPSGSLEIDDLEINSSKQGKLTAQLEAIDGSFEKYYVDLKLQREAFKGFNAKGYLDFSTQTPQIDLQAHLEDFKLDLFSPLGKDVLSKIRGTASGDFAVSGPMNNPEMLGNLYLQNAGLKFPYLNIDFDFGKEQEIGLFQQSFVIEELDMKDTQEGTTGKLQGSISHDHFQSWSIDLVIDSDRLLALNTKESDDALFYGTAFIDGSANIHGYTDNLTIDVNAKTLAGTEFVIPLSDVKTVEESSLIYFVEKKDDKDLYSFEEVFQLDEINGVNLNFNLEVTNDAVAEIVIDKSSGSSIRGSGNGDLILEIDTKGKFNMFGNFVIDQGVYNFAYGGIINKPFTVKKGGTITWTGNPFLAELNIQAIHTVYANPKSLLENLNTNRRIPVELVTDISGEIYSTNQEFDIVIPNSSSVVSNELDFVLNNNDSNEKMRQFFSLLLTKNFFNENNLSNAGSSVVTGTTTDLISGVLSDILNSPDSKLQVDVGYSVADRSEVSNLNLDDQFDISLATQINDKILINGKVGVPVGGSSSDNAVIGEVKVEFLMNEDGTFRTTIFNRQNEIQYSEEEEGYTQGVGMSYQIDFDQLSEVWAKFKRKKKRLSQSSDIKLKSNKELNNIIYMIPSGI